MEDLFNYINPHNGKHSPMVAKSTLDIVLANKDVCIMLFWGKNFYRFFFKAMNTFKKI